MKRRNLRYKRLRSLMMAVSIPRPLQPEPLSYGRDLWWEQLTAMDKAYIRTSITSVVAAWNHNRWIYHWRSDYMAWKAGKDKRDEEW